MTVKISEDGDIVSNNETVTSRGTVIAEDGTIISTKVSGASSRQRTTRHTAPESPLENSSNEGAYASEQASTGKSLSDLEYDLMVKNGQAKNAFPKQAIIVACIFGVLSLIVSPVAIIPAVIAIFYIVLGFKKKAKLEEEVAMLEREIENVRDNLNR